MKQPEFYTSLEIERLLESIPEHKKNASRKNMRISAAIADKMERLSWSPKDLGDRMDCHKVTVYKWLSGHHNFDIKLLAKLEEVLQIELFVIKDGDIW